MRYVQQLCPKTSPPHWIWSQAVSPTLSILMPCPLNIEISTKTGQIQVHSTARSRKIFACSRCTLKSTWTRSSSWWWLEAEAVCPHTLTSVNLSEAHILQANKERFSMCHGEYCQSSWPGRDKIDSLLKPYCKVCGLSTMIYSTTNELSYPQHWEEKC